MRHFEDLDLALYSKITKFETDADKQKQIIDVVFFAMEAVAEKLQSQVEQQAAKIAELREVFDLEVNRCFWLLEQGSPAKWITHSEDYLKLIRQLAVDAPYIKSFEERSGIGMDKAWAFTGDSGKAIKFDSKEKAERFAKEKMLLEYGVVALEHMFMEMPATDEEKLNYIAKALASTDSSNWLAEQKAQWRREVLVEAINRVWRIKSCLPLAMCDVAINEARDELRRMAASPKVEPDKLVNPAGY